MIGITSEVMTEKVKEAKVEVVLMTTDLLQLLLL